MPPKRKLFMTHAGELAHLLVRAVGHGGEVTRFVQSYAERNDRRTLQNNPPNLREIESTIGREALLVMAAEVRRVVPHALASSRPEEAAFAQAFAEEFLAALGRAMASSLPDAPSEADTFRRDLEMYDRWTVRRSPSVSAGRAGSAESPFSDRCALLLDPSMMELARRAAVEFEVELAALAAKVFERLGRGGLPRQGKSRRPTLRPGRKRLRRRLVKVARHAKKFQRRPKKSPRPGKSVRHRKSHPPRKWKR